MGDRFYLQNATAPFTPTAFRGGWDQTAATTSKLASTKAGAQASATVAETSTDPAWDVCCHRAISDPLAAQTISGTLSAIIMAAESASANNMLSHLHVWVTVGDSDTVRGTLIADAIGGEFGGTLAGSTFAASAALTSVAVTAGDRLVVEVGYRSTASDATSHTGTILIGGTGADATNGTQGTTLASWIEFSGLIEMQTPTQTRISQVAVEVLRGGLPQAQVSQVAVEVLRGGVPQVDVSQVAVEVLRAAVITRTHSLTADAEVSEVSTVEVTRAVAADAWINPPHYKLLGGDIDDLAPEGGWDRIDDAPGLSELLFTGLMLPEFLGGLGTSGWPFDALADTSTICRIFIGPSLKAQTVSGGATVTARVHAFHGQDPGTLPYLRAFLYVRALDGSVRGVLADATHVDPIPEWVDGNTVGYAYQSLALPLTPVAIESGDRLVLELGLVDLSGVDTGGYLDTGGTWPISITSGRFEGGIVDALPVGTLAFDQPLPSPESLTELYLDGIVQTSVATDLTASALVQAAQTTQVTGTALLRDTGTKQVTASGFVVAGVTVQVDASGLVFGSGTKELAADARVSDGTATTTTKEVAASGLVSGGVQTKLYLSNSTSAWSGATSAYKGAWTVANFAKIGMTEDPSGITTSTSRTITDTTSANPNSGGALMFVSPLLSEDQTIAGMLDGILGLMESSASANMTLKLHAWVTQGDTAAVRGTLLSNWSEASSNEFPTTNQGHQPAFQIPLTSVAALTGDRIVVEVGFEATNSVSTTFTARFFYGATTQTELTEGNSNVTTQLGWIGFTQDIAFVYTGRGQSVVAGGLVRETKTKELTASAVLIGPGTSTALAATALVRASQVVELASNALVRETQATELSAGGLVRDLKLTTVDTDALVLAAQALELATDATVSVFADTRDLDATALVRQTVVTEVGADGVLRQAVQTELGATALVQASPTQELTASGLVFVADVALETTASALLRHTVTHEVVAGAELVFVTTAALDATALVLATQASEVAADALLRAVAGTVGAHRRVLSDLATAPAVLGVESRTRAQRELNVIPRVLKGGEIL